MLFPRRVFIVAVNKETCIKYNGIMHTCFRNSTPFTLAFFRVNHWRFGVVLFKIAQRKTEVTNMASANKHFLSVTVVGTGWAPTSYKWGYGARTNGQK